jgi:hypothetical protein
MNQVAARRNQGRLAGVGLLADAAKRQKSYLIVFASLLIGLCIALAVFGRDYYLLDRAQRPFSPKHFDLKPSGIIGLRLGMLGLGLFAMVYLYPLRKYWPVLGRIGKTKNWFDFHVLLGLMTPLIITFHSAFRYHGFAGMAYWTMIALVGSGLIGRYFYAQIPRNISAAEMSIKEMQDLKKSLLNELETQKIFPISEIESLFRLPDSQAIRRMSALRAVGSMIAMDMARPFKIASLRRKGMKSEGVAAFGRGLLSTGSVELEKVIRLASRQAALSKRILFLSKTHGIFKGWHVIHRPFSISVAIFVLIHIAVVIWLGYY